MTRTGNEPTPQQRRRLGVLEELARKRQRGSSYRLERFRRKMERKRQLQTQYLSASPQIDLIS